MVIATDTSLVYGNAVRLEPYFLHHSSPRARGVYKQKENPQSKILANRIAGYLIFGSGTGFYHPFS
jgi:hypothetical protein